VAVAVSGGKDSNTLLDLLLRFRKKRIPAFEIMAVTVDGTTAGLPDIRPKLEPWFVELEVEYSFIPLDLPPDEPQPLGCFRCSWNRRKALFLSAHASGCNKLALGHTSDDAAVTVLMNLLYTGRLETLRPKVGFFDGTVTVIRPLIYLSQAQVSRYARLAGLPVCRSCLLSEDSRRRRIARLLRDAGGDKDQIRVNLWRAARRAMSF
jgi:tRNA 2-thiocytidine biosynthesis protein TtcA